MLRRADRLMPGMIILMRDRGYPTVVRHTIVDWEYRSREARGIKLIYALEANKFYDDPYEKKGLMCFPDDYFEVVE